MTTDTSASSNLLARTIAPEGLLGGRYRIGERVGAGGMATIFRAYDPVLERDVAVKVVHAHLAGDQVLIERFRHEARHAASLDHPNVVHVYDAGVADLPYIVMEYIDGPSLRQILQQRGRLSAGETLTVLEPIAHALARAHARGVIHRDVKPENILLASDGRAKIADFGIARTMAATSQTRTGQLIGTVHYLAPELVDGRDATPASDQYALGIVAFEMLTGRKALPADSPAAVAMRHARETVPTPGDVITDSNRRLDRVVARATARSARDRFESLSAFADALRAAVPGGPRPLTFTTGDEEMHTLVVEQAAVATATVAAVDDVEAREPAERRLAGMPVPAFLRGRSAKKSSQPPSGAGLSIDGTMRRPSRVRALRARARRPLRRRRTLRLTLLVLGIFVLTALAAGAYYNFVVAPVQTVPDLVGIDEHAAAETLAERGLGLEVSERAFDLQAPEGSILRQEPAQNTRLRSGNAVTVAVSRGLDTTEVPDITGRTVEEATTALGDSTLGEVRVAEEVYSDTVARGRIIAQAPEAGATVDQLTDVDVTVSRGVEQVEVPDVVGVSREEAEAALADAKLAAETSTEFSDDVPTENEVISQSVEPGSTVDKDTAVELVVSAGPMTIDMPDVRTKPLNEAVAELESLGLEVDIAEDPVPTVGPFTRGVPGRAEETIPQAGKEVVRGDRVLIYTFVGG